MIRISAGFIGITFLVSCFLDSPVKPSESPDELAYNYWLLQRLYIHPEQLRPMDLFYEKADSMEKAGYKVNIPLDGLSQRQFFATARLYQDIPDPYTRYVPPEKAEEQKQHDTSTVIQGGLGIEYIENQQDTDSARLEILRVYPDSPADSAGLLSGDRLIRLNGASLCTDSAMQIFQTVMRDSTWIRPDIIRHNGTTLDTLHFDILRGTVYVPTVFLDSLDGIPILELRQFMRTSIRNGGSIDEFRQALQASEGYPVRILDLRGNPGGEVRVCLDMADEFVGEVPMIHLIGHSFDPRGRASVDTLTKMGTPGGAGLNQDVIIAMDSNSASCAEIFIAALKANLGNKVTLVGTNSYGKAIGQSRWDTPSKGLAIITSLEIRSPDWSNYQNVGIEPDIRVPLDQILPQSVSLAHQKAGLARKSSPSSFPKHLLFQSDMNLAHPLAGAWMDSTEISP